jgi:beta-glucosidase
VPVLRTNAHGAKVGITLNTSQCEPASRSEADRDAARQFDGELNRWFLDPLYLGSYPQDVIEAHERAGHLANDMNFVQPGDLEAIRTPTDFLGVNYYTRAVVRSDKIPEEENEPRTVPIPDPVQLTDMGWEVYPEGLKESLVRIHAQYGPSSLVITENGAAYARGPGPDGCVNDRRRCNYIKRHVQACFEAIEAGVPLEGYFLWSLLDNFEWAFGYTKRFGIVWVNFETQERIVKASARLYSHIVRNDGLPPKEQAA